MLIVGLTGSIGMGKSTVAGMLLEKGIPVFDADAAVHALYAGEGAQEIEREFPGVVIDGVVDRGRLSERIAGNEGALRRLESIIHPMVRDCQRDFLNAQSKAGAQLAVLEIPLLFESRGDKRCDATLVVSAPKEVQKTRVLERPGMTEDKFRELAARQMPDKEKRARADFVVDTGVSVAETEAQISDILKSLEGLSPKAFEAYWRHEG